jgi:hypothetical protein
MNSSISQAALSRLLTLSNRAYDLDNQLTRMDLPDTKVGQLDSVIFTPGPIAELQDDIDQTVRAGLVTLWLADSAEPE